MNEEQPTPSFPRRLLAIVYDALLVIALVGVINGLALAVQVKLMDSSSHALYPPVAQGLIVLSVYGFFILFWLAGGQTLGMQAWRIKLVSSNSDKLTFKQTLLRCLAASLSTACLGCGYLWCLIDPERKYWHDRLSNTELILLPKKGGSGPGEKPAELT